ncbi:MAG: hypothetical protein K8R36_12990 [Planctomycetales bacterium]|nr:hypothetical protein [Planctomycetales bacterium]
MVAASTKTPESKSNESGHTSGELKVITDATCTFCGCVCDDIDLTTDGHKIIEAKRACVLGKAWFLNHEVEDRPACLIEGKPASVAEGVERAAQILANAKYPLVYGLSDTTTESQRVAVSIADWVGASVDTTTSVCHGPSGMAFQGVGEVTCSLGEVRNRGDLIIFELDPAQVLADTGQPLSVWQDLAERMKKCRFGVIFFGMGVTMTRGKHANSEALLALTRDLNKYTRFVCKPNRGHGNVTGADNVVTWRTGYPFGVHLGRGYPRFNPGEYTSSDVLARGEADAAMIIASDPMANFSQPAREHLASIPFIAFDPKETPTTRAATVSFCVATYGINVPGTVYRMDDVPIPLRPAFESPFPSDFEILTALEKRVRELKAGSYRHTADRVSQRPA